MTFVNRIAKLESKFSRADAIKIVVVLEGESNANALARVGFLPNVRGVVFITPLDEDL